MRDITISIGDKETTRTRTTTPPPLDCTIGSNLETEDEHHNGTMGNRQPSTMEKRKKNQGVIRIDHSSSPENRRVDASSVASSVSGFQSVQSVASSRQLIQELSFSLEVSREERALWFAPEEDEEGDDDSSSEDDGSGPCNPNDSFLVGSFASPIPKLDSDDEDEDNFIPLYTPLHSNCKVTKEVSSISIQRLAQHHIYLTAMCLAYARRQEEVGGSRENIVSTHLEYVVDDTLGFKEGRPYPADIWQIWSSFVSEKQRESPLLAEVIIHSIHQSDHNDIMFAICISPQLDLVTVVLSADPKRRLGLGLKEYNCHGTKLSIDACWGELVFGGERSLVKEILEQIPQRVSHLSFVGVNGGAALATLCGLQAALVMEDTKPTISCSIYSFGAPRIGDARIIQLYRRLEEVGKLRIIRFVHDRDAMTRRPRLSWRFTSGYCPVGRTVMFSSKAEGMYAYSQHLQQWEVNVSLEDWLQAEPTKNRWSKKWIFVCIVLLVYIPIILVTLQNQIGSERTNRLAAKPDDSATSTTILKSDGFIERTKVSESWRQYTAGNLSYQPHAKAQLANPMDLEERSAKTDEDETKDEIKEKGWSRPIVILAGHEVRYDVLVPVASTYPDKQQEETLEKSVDLDHEEESDLAKIVQPEHSSVHQEETLVPSVDAVQESHEIQESSIITNEYLSSNVDNAHNTEDTILEQVHSGQDSLDLRSDVVDPESRDSVDLGPESKRSNVGDGATNSEPADILNILQMEVLEHTSSNDLTIDENVQSNEFVPEPNESVPSMSEVTIPDVPSFSEGVTIESEGSIDQYLSNSVFDSALRDEIGNNEERGAEFQTNVGETTEETNDSKRTIMDVATPDQGFLGLDSLQEDMDDGERGTEGNQSFSEDVSAESEVSFDQDRLKSSIEDDMQDGIRNKEEPNAEVQQDAGDNTEEFDDSKQTTIEVTKPDHTSNAGDFVQEDAEHSSTSMDNLRGTAMRRNEELSLYDGEDIDNTASIDQPLQNAPREVGIANDRSHNDSHQAQNSEIVDKFIVKPLGGRILTSEVEPCHDIETVSTCKSRRDSETKEVEGGVNFVDVNRPDAEMDAMDQVVADSSLESRNIVAVDDTLVVDFDSKLDTSTPESDADLGVAIGIKVLEEFQSRNDVSFTARMTQEEPAVETHENQRQQRVPLGVPNVPQPPPGFAVGKTFKTRSDWAKSPYLEWGKTVVESRSERRAVDLVVDMWETKRWLKTQVADMKSFELTANATVQDAFHGVITDDDNNDKYSQHAIARNPDYSPGMTESDNTMDSRIDPTFTTGSIEESGLVANFESLIHERPSTKRITTKISQALDHDEDYHDGLGVSRNTREARQSSIGDVSVFHVDDGGDESVDVAQVHGIHLTEDLLIHSNPVQDSTAPDAVLATEIDKDAVEFFDTGLSQEPQTAKDLFSVERDHQESVTDGTSDVNVNGVKEMKSPGFTFSAHSVGFVRRNTEARFDFARSPYLEWGRDIVASQSKQQSLQHIFQMWDIKRWLKSQAAEKVDVEATATAIVQEGFRKAGVEFLIEP